MKTLISALTRVVLVAVAMQFVATAAQAAESSHKFGRKFSGIQARALADVFDTATGHDHDGTDSMQLSTGSLGAGSVTTPKIAPDAVTEIKILDASVSTNKVEADAITSAKIYLDAVTETKILDASVSTNKIEADAVVEAKILDGAVSTLKIESSAVTTAKLYLDLPTSGIVCITTAKLLGTCTAVTDAAGTCGCN